MKRKPVDITKEFIRNSKPGIGHIYLEQGINYDSHKYEIDTANWILNTFGGEIIVLKEKNLYKIKTPDFEWNYRYWELKYPSSKTSVQRTIRKANKQIINRPGGTIIDLLNYKDSFTSALQEIVRDILDISKYKEMIIVKNKEKLIAVYGNKKRS